MRQKLTIKQRRSRDTRSTRRETTDPQLLLMTIEAMPLKKTGTIREFPSRQRRTRLFPGGGGDSARKLGGQQNVSMGRGQVPTTSSNNLHALPTGNNAFVPNVATPTMSATTDTIAPSTLPKASTAAQTKAPIAPIIGGVAAGLVVLTVAGLVIRSRMKKRKQKLEEETESAALIPPSIEKQTEWNAVPKQPPSTAPVAHPLPAPTTFAHNPPIIKPIPPASSGPPPSHHAYTEPYTTHAYTSPEKFCPSLEPYSADPPSLQPNSLPPHIFNNSGPIPSHTPTSPLPATLPIAPPSPMHVTIYPPMPSPSPTYHPNQERVLSPSQASNLPVLLPSPTHDASFQATPAEPSPKPSESLAEASSSPPPKADKPDEESSSHNARAPSQFFSPMMDVIYSYGASRESTTLRTSPNSMYSPYGGIVVENAVPPVPEIPKQP
ncbi:uncharacterized protein VTP21DRAFT_294 [Calcarisporiella thermophila]|uniref:uncharacterized protein n=1 Tax=Calcarisporiella thermophila TaxID=911321 RepID=UPI00374354BB